MWPYTRPTFQVSLTHCSLLTPFSVGSWLTLVQCYLVTWRHQAITWTNVDLLSTRSSQHRVLEHSNIWNQSHIFQGTMSYRYIKHVASLNGKFSRQFFFFEIKVCLISKRVRIISSPILNSGCHTMYTHYVFVIPGDGMAFVLFTPGPLFTKKTPSYQYRDSHYKPETVVWPS